MRYPQIILKCTKKHDYIEELHYAALFFADTFLKTSIFLIRKIQILRESAYKDKIKVMLRKREVNVLAQRHLCQKKPIY